MPAFVTFSVPTGLCMSMYGSATCRTSFIRPTHARHTARGRSTAVTRRGHDGMQVRALVAEGGAPAVKLVACDMDGTLLTTDKQVSAANVSTISRLIDETDVIFVPATGKSRAGAIKSMGILGEKLCRLYPNGCPGVYLQGLIVFDRDGAIVYENAISDEVSTASANLAHELQLDLIAYSRDTIFCERRSAFTDLLPLYHEPQATEVHEWAKVIGVQPLNKMIFMATPSRIDEIRSVVQARLGHMAHLTQAQGNMLEVLPPNSSKGEGVRQLLLRLDVHPDNVMAIGDAENDIELLQMVGYSCTVGNALSSAKAVAKYTDFCTNDEDAVAQVLTRFVPLLST